VKQLLSIIIFLLFGGFTLNAQKVYKTSFKSEADKIIYVTEFKSEADMIVFETKFKSEANGDSGDNEHLIPE
jgi:hypothetical protein